MIREPVNRYLSEWKHVQRGATWRRSKHICNGRAPSKVELTPCYTDIDWSEVSLDEFMNCSSNLANNRQTRMLADLTIVDCYNVSFPGRSGKMLHSAETNLQNMSFFGLLEHLTMTQYLFHRTFGLIFTELWIPLNLTHSRLSPVSVSTQNNLLKINNLDVQLYRFAERLFFDRLLTRLLEDRTRIENCCQDLSLKVDWFRLENVKKGSLYIQESSELFNGILRELLILDGSKPPSDLVLEERRHKWRNKIWNDMQSDLDLNEDR